MIGSQITHYQITAKLGQGGMGEVYRAMDTKLDREVAIKVLPGSVAQDPERLARFEREAKVLAQLSHPNVASVFGFDQHEGTWFLVMECVAGEDLSERLKRGALSLEESLEVSRQVAEALEAAHERGIIHRDLKPANIKVTPEGKVKVLDFGLAKALGGDPDEVGQASSRAGAAVGEGARGRSPHQGAAEGEVSRDESPTLTDAFTMPGAILGTAAYMSPEQARGKVVDARTDVWSFGCLLYECLTGESLFRGETAMDSIGAVLHREPDWSQLPAATPQAVRFLLRRCLAKESDRRLSEMRQARIELEEGGVESPNTDLPALSPGSGPRGQRYGLGAMVGALVLGILFGVGLFMMFKSRALHSVEDELAKQLKLRLDLPDVVHERSRTSTLLSPDGMKIVYSWDELFGDNFQVERTFAGLYVKQLDELTPLRPLLTSWSPKPFWSPRSRELGVFADKQLLRVPIDGGEATPIATLPDGWRQHPWSATGAAWLSDDRIVFSSGLYDGAPGLWQVEATGGEPLLLLALADGEVTFSNPSPLPDGRGVLFLVESVIDTEEGSKRAINRIEALYDGERLPILELGDESIAFAVYDRRGYVIYDRVTTNPGLWALPVSTDRLTPTGEKPFFIAKGTDPSLSDNGALLYLEGTPAHDPRIHQLAWLEVAGRLEPIADLPHRSIGDVRVSEDLTKALMSAGNAGEDQRAIIIQDLSRPGIENVITNPPEGFTDFLPEWHPDGEHVLFVRAAAGLDSLFKPPLKQVSIMQARLDRKSEPTVLVDNASGTYSVSRDGRYLFYPTGQTDIDGAMKVESHYRDLNHPGTLPRQLRLRGLGGFSASLSPDGRYLAYIGIDSERLALYVTDFPACERHHLVSPMNVVRCFWGKDKENLSIHFLEIRGSLLYRKSVAPTAEGDSLVFGDRELIYNVNDRGLEHRHLGDVTPDGRKYLVPQRVDFEYNRTRNVVYVKDWLADFKSDSSGIKP